ncbi:MAG: GntR family transcriptional regulator [Beijerinckiaceae bacterium]
MSVARKRATGPFVAPRQGEAEDEPPRRETLAERAYRILEDRIVTLKLEPGAWLTEQDLAARTGLGRTPVREALQRLIGDGLVQVFPRRGVLVPDINPIDVFLALDTRAALERLQARGAAKLAKPQERKQCLAYAIEMRGYDPGADVDRYMELDHACDLLLASAAANPFTLRALAPLLTSSRRAWYRFCRDQDLAPAAALHADLMEAVSDGDAEGAERAVSALIDHVRDAIRAGIAKAR